MTDIFKEKMNSLEFELSSDHIPPTEELVKSFEKEFELELPEDFKTFLLNHAGKNGDASTNFLEPTPMGKSTFIDSFYGFSQTGNHSIHHNTDLIDGAPYVIAIGDNSMGAMFWLKCLGDDKGYVYMHDHEGRSAWDDDFFHHMYSNLSDDIKEYLNQRSQGQLPNKKEGYEHVYIVGRSFTEFIENLEKIDWDAA